MSRSLALRVGTSALAILAAAWIVAAAHAVGSTAEFIVVGGNSSQGTMRAMLCTESERFPNGCKRATHPTAAFSSE